MSCKMPVLDIHDKDINSGAIVKENGFFCVCVCMCVCFKIDKYYQCLDEPLSEKLPLAAHGNKHRHPKTDITMQREQPENN